MEHISILDKECSKDDDDTHESDCGPEAAVAMCRNVYQFVIPGGNGSQALGELIDRSSPNHLQSYAGRNVIQYLVRPADDFTW